MVRDIEDEIRDEKNPRPLLKTYKVEKEIKELAKRINDLCGIKASDTCLAPPSPWDLESDEQIMQEGQPLQVGRCTEIIRPNIEDAKYVINVKQIAKSVVGLGDKVSPTDIEQGTRVGYISCLRETPIDLLMDIFSRVPAKSIARFRCLSKLWESILCRPDFTELFLTMSSTRPPLLLFTFEDDGKLFFFSSPHPQNPDENTSLVPTRYCVQHKNCPTNFSSEIGSPLRGFICHQDRGSQDTIVICNPVTGESVCLPKVELKSINTETRPYLGYDPIHKQLKVLCIKSNDIPNTCDEHQVLTLENGKHLWRTIQCKPHYPKSDGICLDGILYYTAGFDRRIRVSMIVCFDVGSEKFSFINIDDCMLMTAYCTLINYKGKLGALQFTFLFPRRLEFWVLDNAERYAWSKDIYTLPPLWNNIVERTELAIVGMTGGGDVVLSPYCIVDAFYIYYFNLETKTLTRVQIQGLEMFKRTRFYTSQDYVENLKLM